jgi:hypothetical protein
MQQLQPALALLTGTDDHGVPVARLQE